MYASETERLEEFNFRRRRDVTVDYVSNILPPDGRVLDLGCGAAPVLAELRQRGISCVGLDYAEDMLKHGRERLQSMGLATDDLYQGDCQHTPFDDEAFEVVVCLGVISYVERYEEVLREINRLLVPGGTALVSFRNKHNPLYSDPVRWAKTFIKKLIGRTRPEKYVIGRFMDFQEFQVKMAEAGFSYKDFFGIGFGPFKLNRHKVFSEKTSISISKALTAFFGKLGWQAPFRWLTDVSLWVYQKDPPRN